MSPAVDRYDIQDMRHAITHFFDKIRVANPDDADSCWEWTGSCNGKGYGNFCCLGTNVSAHRFIYYLTHPGVSLAGVIVMHTCDNPKCCRPSHLFIGTHQDNSDDKVRKGRHGSAKINATTAALIKGAPADITDKALADLCGITWGAIRLIRSGRRWKHVAPRPWPT
jgi:hypothetical protein